MVQDHSFEATLARHYNALDGRIPHLLAFVEEVIADVESFHCARCGTAAAQLVAGSTALYCTGCLADWPAPATFEDAAWDEAKARYDAEQMADMERGEGFAL